MIRRGTNIMTAILTPLVLLGCTSGRSFADRITEIESAWTRRETRLASCVIEWDEHRLMAGHSFQVILADGNSASLPDRDMKFVEHSKLALSGDKLSSVFMTNGWNDDAKRFSTVAITSVIGGHSGSRQLFVDSLTPSPRGAICDEDKFFYRDLLNAKPILYWLRPLNRHGLRMRLHEFIPMSNSQLIDGAACIVLVKRKANQTEYLYVDENTDYCLRAYELLSGDTLRVRIAIKYVRDRGFLRPSSWKAEQFGPNSLLSSVDAQVTSFEPNVAVASSEFEIEFPLGCQVSDKTKGKIYRTTADGMHVIMDYKVRDANLKNNQLDHRANIKTYIMIANVSVIFVGAIWYMARTFYRQRASK